MKERQKNSIKRREARLKKNLHGRLKLQSAVEQHCTRPLLAAAGMLAATGYLCHVSCVPAILTAIIIVA
jgi:hypothetical protein